MRVYVLNSLSGLNEKKGKKRRKKIYRWIERKMRRRKNQLSDDEHIWEAVFVVEKSEARLAAWTQAAVGNEESNCLTKTWQIDHNIYIFNYSFISFPAKTHLLQMKKQQIDCLEYLNCFGMKFFATNFEDFLLHFLKWFWLHLTKTASVVDLIQKNIIVGW